jgi:hypothetical protein
VVASATKTIVEITQRFVCRGCVRPAPVIFSAKALRHLTGLSAFDTRSFPASSVLCIVPTFLNPSSAAAQFDLNTAQLLRRALSYPPNFLVYYGFSWSGKGRLIGLASASAVAAQWRRRRQPNMYCTPLRNKYASKMTTTAAMTPQLSIWVGVGSSRRVVTGAIFLVATGIEAEPWSDSASEENHAEQYHPGFPHYSATSRCGMAPGFPENAA